jgi:hypothetical protein
MKRTKKIAAEGLTTFHCAQQNIVNVQTGKNASAIQCRAFVYQQNSIYNIFLQAPFNSGNCLPAQFNVASFSTNIIHCKERYD